MPKDQRRTGVILYLHGGGYTCGSLEYAKGFASTLATECGVRVFCAAYRLAPEHPYPAALEDALESYEYLLKKGYPARQILLCGRLDFCVHFGLFSLIFNCHMVILLALIKSVDHILKIADVGISEVGPPYHFRRLCGSLGLFGACCGLCGLCL